MSTYEVKTWSAQVKAADGAPEGTFRAVVSVFGNVDSGGDRMVKGAFAESLKRWGASGDPLPVIWSHDWDNPESHIGVVTKAVETDEGLVVDAKLDVESNPKAAQVARLLKERRITQFSFGYRATDWAMVKDPESPFGEVRELRAVDVFEVGPTLLGMNEDTRLIQAASATAGFKLGRALNAKNEELVRSAHASLSEVLSALDDGKSAPAPAPAVVEATVDGPAVDVVAETVADVVAEAPVEQPADAVVEAPADTVEQPAGDSVEQDEPVVEAASTLPPEVLSRLNELLIELRETSNG